MARSAALFVAVTMLVVPVSAADSARRTAIGPTRIASDPFGASTPGAHATIVEPSAASAGSTVVTTFQVGRNAGGGSAAIGFATSADAGVSWRSGFLPGLTAWTSTPGTHQRASDPVVAYDASHGRFLAATLAGPDLTISTSPDGVSWAAPVTATSGFLDKEWLTCDGWRESPFLGRCYLAYTRFDPPGVNLRLEVETSVDGGTTWSPPVVIAIDNSLLRFEDTLSAEPVVRPNGELVLFFFEGQRIGAARSTDGGQTFGPRETVADLEWHSYSFAPEHLRAPNIPSVAVDAAGIVYAVWSDCRFRPGCAGNDIVLTQSSAPGAWTPPERIPLAAPVATEDLVLPALSIQPQTRGEGAHVALAYYSLTSPDCAGDSCRLAARLATTRNGGRSWTAADVGDPMRLDWLAPTSIGRMVGDYVASVFVPGRALGIVVLAGPPQGASLEEALFVAPASDAADGPQNLRRPRVLGLARVGQTVRCDRGSWSGTPPVEFTFRWLSGGRAIPRGRGVSHRLTRRDAGAPIACRVRAENEGGARIAVSRAVRVRR